MFQGKGVDLHPKIFIDFLLIFFIQGMKAYGIVEFAFIIADDVTYAFSKGLMGIDMQVFASVEQVKGGEQSEQSIYVVTMNVADEDVVDPGEFDPVASELHLGAFAAVNQKEPLIYIEYMSGQVSFGSRQSRAAAQYGQFKSHILCY